MSSSTVYHSALPVAQFNVKPSAAPLPLLVPTFQPLRSSHSPGIASFPVLSSSAANSVIASLESMYSSLCRLATRPSLSVVVNSLSGLVAVEKSGSMGRSEKGRRQLSACTAGSATFTVSGVSISFSTSLPYLTRYRILSRRRAPMSQCISDPARPVSRRVPACAPFTSLPLPPPMSAMVARAGDRSGPSCPARGAIVDCGGGAAWLAAGGVSPVADNMRAGSRCAKPVGLRCPVPATAAEFPQRRSRGTHAAPTLPACAASSCSRAGAVVSCTVARKRQESQWGSVALSSALSAFCDDTACGALYCQHPYLCQYQRSHRRRT
ncbi:hypothetical protein DFH06DRAFT_1350724 [Mycena polygramma]|nr:hypothetical protein DFH06DRAFT_1350724 [Mycena polygramma]